MAVTQEEYVRRIRRLLSQVDRLDKRSVSRARLLLRELKQRIDAEVARTPIPRARPGQPRPELPFARFSQNQTKQAVADAAEEFSRRYASELDSMDQEILDLVNDFRKGLQTAAPRKLGAPILSVPQLEIVQGFRADLIADMNREIVGRVSNEINLGVLGGKSPFEIQQAIRPFISPLKRKMPDGTTRTTGALARAERISRTESNRIFNLVQDAQVQSDAEFLSERGEVAMKIWIATNDGRTRPGHLEAERRYGPNGSIGPIPVDQPFEVRPTPFAPFEKLMHPLDPAGSAANTVNCRCTHAIVTPELVSDFVPTQQQSRRAARQGRRAAV